MRGNQVARRALVLVAVIAVFAVALAAKGFAPSSAESGRSELTESADEYYERALAGDTPIYVLFHSSTCVPCIEIEKVTDVVMPEYEGRVAFVDALAGAPGVDRLAAEFPFQYVPTSFFLDSNGNIVEQYTGALTAEEMRAKLDRLVR